MPTSPAQLLTHQVDAVARLVSQYVGKANMEAFAGVIGQRAQSIEDALWLLVSERTLDAAVGQQLDDIGAKVGEARQGKADAEYRVFVRARILVNLSSGTGPQLQALFDLLYTALGDNVVDVEEWFPACLWVLAHDVTSSADAQALANIMATARAGGVRGLFTYSLALDAATLTCGTPQAGDDGEDDPPTGLAGPTVLSDGGGYEGGTVFTAEAGTDLIALFFPTTGTVQLLDETTGAVADHTYTGRTSSALTGLSPAIPDAWTGVIYASLPGGSLAGVKEA
jgi:hypothetical protein